MCHRAFGAGYDNLFKLQPLRSIFGLSMSIPTHDHLSERQTDGSPQNLSIEIHHVTSLSYIFLLNYREELR